MFTWLTPPIQNLAALAVVAAAALWLAVRWRRRRRSMTGGCRACSNQRPPQSPDSDFIPLEAVGKER